MRLSIYLYLYLLIFSKVDILFDEGKYLSAFFSDNYLYSIMILDFCYC